MSTEKEPRLFLGMHRPEWEEFFKRCCKDTKAAVICTCGAGLSRWNYSHYELQHPELRAHWQAGHFDEVVTISRAEMLALLARPLVQTPPADYCQTDDVSQALAKEEEAPPDSVLLDFLQSKLLTDDYPYARLRFVDGELCQLSAAINERNGPDPQNPSSIAYLSGRSVRQVIAAAMAKEKGN